MSIQRVIVVGAGIIGLSTAWFLQEHGISVVVIDADGVAAGASWGNAGWIAPSQAEPLTDPHILGEGVTGLTRRDGPLSIEPRFAARRLSFLMRFVAQCTPRRARHARLVLSLLNDVCAEAWETLAAADAALAPVPARIVAAIRDPRWSTHLDDVPGALRLEIAQANRVAPQLDGGAGLAYSLPAHYIDPGDCLRALAASVVARGGELVCGRTARSVRSGVTVDTDDGPLHGDAAVIATGARIGRLARGLGVRVGVAAGRGYSFSVATSRPADHPIYLPEVRIACTPYRGRLRVAGMMELASVGAPARRERFEAMVRSAAPRLTGIDWSDRRDEWVGGRPLTEDGLPLVGATGAAGIYVAGGHGMWGVTQGPATGMLLASQIASGKVPAALVGLDPRR